MGTNGKDHPPEQMPDSNLLEHFLYFPEKSQAEKAGERLRAKGVDCEDCSCCKQY